MALVFYEVHVPEQSRRNHHAAGGRELSMHRAQVNGGWLRAMSGKEPAGKNDAMIHHVSLSIGPEQGAPTRRPTDDECKEALSLWSLVEFEEINFPDGDPKVRNFWEKE